ncbi:MAG: hypothetical protein ABJ387_01355 [Balneola sp.]
MAEKVKIAVYIDASQAKKEGKDVKEVILDIKGASDETSGSVKQMSASTVSAGQLMAQAYSFVAQRAMQVIKATRQMAFDVEETGSKFDTVLGKNVQKANKFLEEHAGLLGITSTEGKEYVSTAVQISKGLKMNEDDAAEFGIEWTKLAGDFQSFFNVPFERGFGAIRSGLVGEQEPLKQFGIVLTEAETQERALMMTGKERADSLTDLEKVQARYALITEKAGVAVGDLERTQNSGANTTRRMEASYREIAEQMAARSIPLWNEIAQSGLEFSGVLKDILGLNISDKLREEQIEMDTLATRLLTVVKRGGDRSQLISDLNEKYPDFLKNLDAENITTKEIADRLKELNAVYSDKIELQIQDEELAELREKQSKRYNLIRSDEIDAIKKLRAAEKELGIQVDETDTLLQRKNKALELAQENSSMLDLGSMQLVSSLKTMNEALLDGSAMQYEKDFFEPLISEAEAAYDTLEKEYERRKKDVGFEDDQTAEKSDPIEIPVKPVISTEKPIDQLLEESLPGEVPEFKVAPKIELGSLSFMRDQLANEEALYTAAATDEERKRHQVRIEFLEKRIQATEEGISVEQLKAREAHQEKMQQAAEYFDMLNQGYQLVADFMGAQTERKIHNIEREQDKALSAIDARLNNDKLSEKEREKLLNQREKAETDYQKKIDKLQHEQFERERIAKIAEVAANTAVAVSKVWGQTGIFGLAAQVPVLAMGAIQAATVLAQPNPYLEGGLLEERLTSGMSSPGKKLISINENNKPEFIMNALSTARSLPLMNRMNKDPKFADRINKAYLSQKPPSFSKPDVTSLNAGIDSNAISAAVGSAISEAMKDVKLYPKITYSEILEAQRQYDQNREAVGNQS